MGQTPLAANVRKLAGVYAIGVRPNVQQQHLQQVTDNAQRNFLVGSYAQLGNYWKTFQNNFGKPKPGKQPCGLFSFVAALRMFRTDGKC